MYFYCMREPSLVELRGHDHSFRVFVPLPFSFCMESMSFGTVFSYLVITDWIFDIALSEKKIHKTRSINQQCC